MKNPEISEIAIFANLLYEWGVLVLEIVKSLLQSVAIYEALKQPVSSCLERR